MLGDNFIFVPIVMQKTVRIKTASEKFSAFFVPL